MGDRLRDGRDRALSAGESAAEAARRRFVAAETRLFPVAGLPEIRLHQADDATSLWQKGAAELAAAGIGDGGAPLPFWAFAWAGGVGIARHILDNPALVRGRHVVDFASGSGLVAIAAARAGASTVAALDIDPFAAAAMRLNAEANDVALTIETADIVGNAVDADILLAGDVFYDRAMTAAVLPWLRKLAASGLLVVAGDPGRHYCPQHGVAVRATITVPTLAAVEDSGQKTVRVLTILPV